MFAGVVDRSQDDHVAVEALTPLLDTLATLDWDTLDRDTLSRCVVSLSRQRDQLEGLCHLAIGAHDRALAWKAGGCRSETQWLATHCNTSRGYAAGQAQTARRLAQLPATTQALADGVISPAHARVAANAARDLPDTAMEALDRLVAQQGPHTDAAQLRDQIHDYTHRVAPGSLHERQQRAWATAGSTSTPPPPPTTAPCSTPSSTGSAPRPS